MTLKANTPDTFWARVDFSQHCWEWQGHIDIGGYGRTSWVSGGVRKSSLPAHRISWEICRGAPAPDEFMVLHHCDNRRCVRPDHLFLGTAKTNSDDMYAKGRGRLGSKHPLAKLTDVQVREIRRKYLRPRTTARMLAEQFGVSEPTIRKITHGTSWKHLL